MEDNSEKATIKVIKGEKVTVKEATVEDAMELLLKEMLRSGFDYLLEKGLAAKILNIENEESSFDLEDICMDLGYGFKMAGVMWFGIAILGGIVYVLVKGSDKIEEELKSKIQRIWYWLAQGAFIAIGIAASLGLGAVMGTHLCKIDHAFQQYEKKKKNKKNDDGEGA